MSPVFTLCMLLWLFHEELNVLNKVQGNRSFLLKQEYFLASAKEQLNSLTGKYFEKYRISSAFGRLQNSSVVFIRPHKRKRNHGIPKERIGTEHSTFQTVFVGID